MTQTEAQKLEATCNALSDTCHSLYNDLMVLAYQFSAAHKLPLHEREIGHTLDAISSGLDVLAELVQGLESEMLQARKKREMLENARSICKQNLADTGELLAVTLAPDVENVIAQGLSPDGNSLTLDPDFTRRMLDNLNGELEKAISSSGNQPVILCSSPIRMPFRRLIERTYPQISVMSYNEISNNIKAKSIGVVRVETMRV